MQAREVQTEEVEPGCVLIKYASDPVPRAFAGGAEAKLVDEIVGVAAVDQGSDAERRSEAEARAEPARERFLIRRRVRQSEVGELIGDRVGEIFGRPFVITQHRALVGEVRRINRGHHLQVVLAGGELPCPRAQGQAVGGLPEQDRLDVVGPDVIRIPLEWRSDRGALIDIRISG